MVLGKTFPLQFVLTGVDHLSGTLGKVEGRIGAIGKQASRIGRGLTLGVTAPILAMGAATVHTAAKFEASMNSVSAITGAQGDEFDALRQKAVDLGGSTAFAASEVADAMTELGIAGFDTNEILAATPAVLDLAAASGTEMARSAEILAGTLRGAKLEATESRRVADALTNTLTSSGVKLEDLAEASKIATPVFAGMNIPLEENLSLIGALGDSMFKGSLGGTALKQALVKLAITDTKALGTLDRLGIDPDSLLDATGRVKSLSGALATLKEKGATPTDLFNIFDVRAAPALLTLIDRGDKIADLEQKIGRTGTAAAIAEAKLAGAAGGMTKLRSAVETLMIKVADSGLLESFTGIVENLTGFVQRTSEANPELFKLATTFGLVVAAVGPALYLFGSATTLLGGMYKGVVLLGKGLMLLAANPVGLAIAGIAALVLVGSHLIENWEDVKKTAGDVWWFVKDAVGGAISWVWTQLKKLATLILPTWLERLLGLGGDAGADVAAALNSGGGLPEVASGPPVIGGSSDPIARSETLARSEKEVRVKFQNLPAGATVESDPGADVDLGMGLALAGGA